MDLNSGDVMTKIEAFAIGGGIGLIVSYMMFGWIGVVGGCIGLMIVGALEL